MENARSDKSRRSGALALRARTSASDHWQTYWERERKHTCRVEQENWETPRQADWIERIRAAHPGGTVVAVSHADPIKAAAADALGTPLDLFQRIAISPCSVTAILYSDGAPMALTVNSVGDLKALAPS